MYLFFSKSIFVLIKCNLLLGIIDESIDHNLYRNKRHISDEDCCNYL